MNETRRTLTYLASAVVLAICAWWLSPPVEITPAELTAAKIGTEFYPDFQDPNEPTSIRVVAFDEAKAAHRTFGVSFENGKWSIPSHHNYPADGADRLAKTAASVMHIKREEIAVGGDSEQNYEKLGVVDPLDEDRGKLKGRGERLTLSKGENTIVDLIIGKKLKDRPGYSYIRKVGENTTYVAKLAVELSTKFGDWIETDLLKLNRDDLKEVVINNYKIDEVNGQLVPGELINLTRDKTADPWKMAGLDEAKEELDVSKINALIAALDDLKLVGVRPKPKGLNADLSLDPEYRKDRGYITSILRDLQNKGFIPLADKNKQPHLYSNEGELAAATNKGVVYTLKFGEVFSGDESEIEIGKTEEEGENEEGRKKADKEGEEGAGKGAAGKQPSRYLFVATQFDEKYLGERPEAPEKPEGLSDDEAGEEKPRINPGTPKKTTKPKRPATEDTPDTDNPAEPGSKKSGDEDPENDAKPDETCTLPAADDDSETEDAAASAEKDGDEKKEKPKSDSGEDAARGKKEKPKAKSAGDEDAGEDEADPKGAKSAEGEDAEKKPSAADVKKDYDAKLRKYNSDLKAYDEKIEAGKKLVDELNARFRDWYYVIPAESFNKLHLARKDLVKDKTKAADDKGDKSGTKPSDPFPGDAKDDPDEDGEDATSKTDDDAGGKKTEKKAGKKDQVKDAPKKDDTDEE